ncbi:MAG: serine hydrolase domain-containing protein [Burkholderiales bacterium]|nr:serine hydrolase domain-containing protein [Burkholderiales bacterium]
MNSTPHDFHPLHAAMRRYVDANVLAGVSSAVLVGQELVDQHCAGWADKEHGVELRPDTLFRVYSNTKLVTSCAALMLFDEGRFGLDDPIERFIPQLANRRVLRPGATSLDDTEPARSPITIRQLMSHSSGLSYGVLDPGTTIFKGYNERKVLNPATPLADMIEQLAGLPLVFHPGTSWEYSVATDVLSRLVEIVSGEAFDAFIGERILRPLGMVDTGFLVPEAQRHRLAAYYIGADLAEPMKPGLTRADDAPYPGAYLRPVPHLSRRGWSGVHLAGHGGPAAQPDPRRPRVPKRKNDRGDDDQSTRRGCAHEVVRAGPYSGHGLRPGRRGDLAAVDPGPRHIDGRAAMGRHRRHPLVDLTEDESCQRGDDAARDGLLAPVLLRVQAPHLRGHRAVLSAANRPGLLDQGVARERAAAPRTQNGNTT